MKLRERHQLMRLAHIAGDLGELRQLRDDPELGEALDLIRVLLERVAGEIRALPAGVDHESS
jgi:hypothetical protein